LLKTVVMMAFFHSSGTAYTENSTTIGYARLSCNFWNNSGKPSGTADRFGL